MGAAKRKSLPEKLCLFLFVCFFAPRSASERTGKNGTETGDNRVDINIGGFFAFKRSPILSLQPGVAQTALDHVNSLAGILDGYRLEMRWNWTGAGDPEESLRHLYTLAYTGPPVPITWGPIISTEAVVVNQVASRFNIVQVGVTSRQVLTDRSIYPYTVRMLYTDLETYRAMVKFFKKMGWRRIAFIYEESAGYTLGMNEFRQTLEADGLQVVLTERVKDISRIEFHLKSIQAYRSGIYGAKYVWIASLWTKATAWWLDASPAVIAPCTQEQINKAVMSTLQFHGNPRREDAAELDFYGVKPLPEHYEYYENEHPPDDLLAYTYDGIVAIALALNASIADLQRLDPPRRLEDFSYSDEEMARVILKNADNLDFNGLLGRVLIQDGQRQSDIVYVEQAKGERLDTVMIYSSQTQQLKTYRDSEIKWQGGHIPVDGATITKTNQEISSTTRTVLFSSASVGSVLAMVFLFINIRYKHKKAIKMSSPSLSNMTVVGCLLLYGSVFASGWDKTDLSDTAIVIKCHVERILLSVGLSLAFGSIFMKTYRIHAIFTLAVKRFKKIDLPDWKLIGGVAIIALGDCVLFVFWITLDPTTVYSASGEPQLNMTQPEREMFDVPVVRFCSSAHVQYFTMALYGMKGVLLTFGLFLAWETRNICVSQLNDSKFIALSLYIVCLTVALTVPTMNIVGDDVNVTFAIPSIAIVLVNTSVLCLNFIPKVYMLLTVDDTSISLSLMQSQGYGESSGTHTFGTEQKSKLTGLQSKFEQRQEQLRADLEVLRQVDVNTSPINLRKRRRKENESRIV